MSHQACYATGNKNANCGHQSSLHQRQSESDPGPVCSNPPCNSVVPPTEEHNGSDAMADSIDAIEAGGSAVHGFRANRSFSPEQEFMPQYGLANPPASGDDGE